MAPSYPNTIQERRVESLQNDNRMFTAVISHVLDKRIMISVRELFSIAKPEFLSKYIDSITQDSASIESPSANT